MEVKTNSVRAWILASRPKTLVGAATPVIIGASMAWRHFVWWLNEWNGSDDMRVDWRMKACEDDMMNFWLPITLCLLFAFIMQIDANFINDYFDFKKGSDREDRLGPERACAQGWVTPGAMKKAIILTTLMACLCGAPLLLFGGWELIAVGLLCVLFCFLYTTRLSYLGWGDVLVLVFFGLVPVGFTYYVATGDWNLELTLAGVACGLATDCLLMVNNYRDRNQDAVSGKKTVVVRFGARFGLLAYLWLGILAMLLGGFSAFLVTKSMVPLLLLWIYAALHVQTFNKMSHLDGKSLNEVLGETARNIFIFGVILAAGVIIG